MDFFSAETPSESVNSHPKVDKVDDFAEAIASRFGSGSGSILTARLIPEHPPPTPAPPSLQRRPVLSLPSFPMANMSLTTPVSAPISTSSFLPVSSSTLSNILKDPGLLVLDIRPHAAFSSARIPHALSLSVPSTLLKRPLFSLERIAAMLPSPAARARFSTWRTYSRILVYDADAYDIPEGSNIHGLLRKFQKDAFDGQLAWVKGGFQAIWRECRQIIITEPPSPDHDDDDDAISLHGSHPAVLRTRRLPPSAFSLPSTTVSPVTQALPPGTSLSSASGRNQRNHRHASNPFFDTIRQNVELSQGITERIPLRLPSRVRRRIHELPFMWLQDIARRAAPRKHSAAMDYSSDESSEDDDSVEQADVEEGMEALAMQFYRIELAEQRRMMGIMEYHSKETASCEEDRTSLAFPFSITAGIEKGAKNRYRHIWPFEHARVRLHRNPGQSINTTLDGEPVDDYVNASYVQPLGTMKRYIATQGPLPATYTDFWTLCWEQNVHVIVMLTREVEGAMVKCGCYWTDEAYGPLRLKLLSTSGAAESDERGFFSMQPRDKPARSHKQSTTIKRTFELRHTEYPLAPPRIVTHLQYLEWPDMNVPEDPRGVLGLVREIEEAVQTSMVVEGRSRDLDQEDDLRTLEGVDERTGIARYALERQSPVLLHCSAGVGRTGGFIAVDALLDAVKREMKRKRSVSAGSSGGADVFKKPSTGVGKPGKLEKVTEGVAMDVDRKQRKGFLPSGFFLPSRKWDRPSQSGDAMTVDGDGTDSSGYSPGQERDILSVTSTRQWAETVSNQIPVKSAASLGYSSPTSSGPSIGNCSQDSLASVIRGKETSSSLGTSVSGSTPALQSFPSTSGPTNHAATLPIPESSSSHVVPQDPRSRTLSAPSKGLFLDAGAAKPGLGMSSLANSSTPWLGHSAQKARSPSPMNTEQREHRMAHYPSKLATSVSLGGPPAESVRPPPSSTRISSPDPMSRSRSLSESLARDERMPPLGAGSTWSMGSTRPSQHWTGQSQSHSTSASLAAEATDRIVHGMLAPHPLVDYKEPRPLHADLSPPILSSFEEPIWEVVQDMREQRMSLCQSLRQYVFVHAAVIEGALHLVDEECLERGVEAPAPGAGGKGVRNIASHSRGRGGYSTSGSAQSSSSSPSRTKRRASPTELPKKNKMGEMSLSKRPSIKQKNGQLEGCGAMGSLLAAPSSSGNFPFTDPSVSPKT